MVVHVDLEQTECRDWLARVTGDDIDEVLRVASRVQRWARADYVLTTEENINP